MSDLDLRMRRPGRRALRRRGAGCLAVLLALAVVLGGVGVVVWRGAHMVSGLFAGADDYSGQGTGNVRIEVAEGDTAHDIGSTLEKAGVVASVEAFTAAASADPRSVSIQPGTYRMHDQMSAAAALSLLVAGDTVGNSAVTVPEGLTVGQTVQRIAGDSSIGRRQLLHAVERPGLLGLPGWAHGDVEGYLFPSTYPVDSHTRAADMLARMVAQLRSEATRLSLVDGAGARGMSPAQIVTIASLVQAEARRPQDFGKVSRVIYNRLAAGMRLQLDSTVHFAANGAGGTVFTSRLQRHEPSQYNTYRHAGLPPGAIDSPGERALTAALHPTHGSWTYFVTVNLATGRTLFTDSFAAHQRNVDRLHRYCHHSDLC